MGAQLGSWRARISGSDADLDRLRAAVASARAFELVEDEDGLQLYTPEFNALMEVATVHSSYTTLVRQINGVLRVEYGFYYSGIRLDNIVRVEPDGSRRRAAIARSNVVGPVLPAEAPPVEPAALKRFADVRGNADLAEATERFVDAKGWPDLYEVFEVIWAHLGGGAGAREKIDSWSGDPGARGRFTGTAKRYRHPRPSNAPPQDLMTYFEGHEFVRAVLNGAIAGLSTAPVAAHST